MPALFGQGGQIGYFRLRVPQDDLDGLNARITAGPNNRYSYHILPF
jgi:hypothetical protein